jgi:opacity protein-like surface antigen
MKPLGLAFLTISLVSASARASLAEEPLHGAVPKTGFFERWVSSRLSFGAAWTHFWLDDTRRSTDHGYDNLNAAGNFLGSLWGLDAKQHALPNPFVEYRLVSSFGLGLAYDQLRAKTLDWADTDRTVTIGDGDVEIRGGQVYAFGRYRTRSRFTPYANLGLARYWSRFLVLPSWTGGKPGRVFQVDDTRGWFVTVGTRVALGRHVGLEAFYRREMIGDVTGRAYRNIINRPDVYVGGAFPMSNNRAGTGLAYTF